MSPQSDTRMSSQLEQMQGQHAKDVLLIAALEHRITTLAARVAELELWKKGEMPFDHLDCDHCGDPAITSATGLFRDGDGTACEHCGFPGHVVCDAETPAEWQCSDETTAFCLTPGCSECAETRIATLTARAVAAEADWTRRHREWLQQQQAEIDAHAQTREEFEALQDATEQRGVDLATAQARVAELEAEHKAYRSRENQFVTDHVLFQAEAANRLAAESALASANARIADLERACNNECSLRVQATDAAYSANARLEAVRRTLEFFRDVTAAARRNREPKTGMQVPYHGEFCSATPSVIRDLEHFVRDFTAALGTPTHEPTALTEARNVFARINRLGGCGYDVHGWIDAWLAAHPEPKP